MADNEEGEVRESVVFQIDDRLVDAWGNEAEEADQPDEEHDSEDYSTWSGPQLLAEIEKRNANRDDDQKIELADRKKSSAVSALEADDSKNQE